MVRVIDDVTRQPMATGRFRFAHLAAGKTIITATSPGRAPDVQTIIAGESTPPVALTLTPATSTVLR